MFRTFQLFLKASTSKAIIIKYMKINPLVSTIGFDVKTKNDYAHGLITNYISTIYKIEAFKDEVHKADKHLLAMAAMSFRGMVCIDSKAYIEALDLQTLTILIIETNNISVKTYLDQYLLDFIQSFVSNENQKLLCAEIEEYFPY